jgi:5-deoxy-5-amino-3-dehydroquinate synthase
VNITVALGERSYDVVLADGARYELAALIEQRAPKAVTAVIVTSPALVEQAWFDIESGLAQHIVTVPDGEAAKTIASLDAVLEQIALLELSRDDVIIGVGGGAVTDVAGFVAGVYLRGVALVNVPTTLVGQVDAAIGGKTAVNLRAGKNLAGVFHQPLGVLCDFATLETLPDRERLGGLGEVAKCWLLEGGFAAELAAVSMHDLIVMSVKFKAAIVGADEREGGSRALLNYGHTLAHALEKVSLMSDANALRHGEAVAIGLAYAVRLAHALGRVDASEIARHDDVLAALELSRVVPPHFSTTSLVEAMAHDKKAHHDLTFVLAGAEGFEVVRGVDPVIVAEVLDRFRGEQ